MHWLIIMCMLTGVRTNNINYAMVAQLQHPHAGFEDVIKTHFYVKKDRILEVNYSIFQFMWAYYVCCIYSNALQTTFDPGRKNYEP